MKLSKKFIINFIEIFFQNVKLDLFWHRLMVQREENMTTKKMDSIKYNYLPALNELGKYKSVIVPLNTSAAFATVSVSVGWG